MLDIETVLVTAGLFFSGVVGWIAAHVTQLNKLQADVLSPKTHQDILKALQDLADLKANPNPSADKINAMAIDLEAAIGDIEQIVKDVAALQEKVAAIPAAAPAEGKVPAPTPAEKPAGT